MTSIEFNSRADVEVVTIEFLAVDGSIESLTLMVDSGFVGTSGFVLPDSFAAHLGHMSVGSSQTAGAIQGARPRAWAIWQIPALSIQRATVAIFSDVSGISLPIDVVGLVGLTFLREFDQWGAERQADGSWRFMLSTS